MIKYKIHFLKIKDIWFSKKNEPMENSITKYKNIYLAKTINKATNFFEGNDIIPDMFITPSHFFDFTKVKCLSDFNYNYISNDLFTSGLHYKNIYWILTRLWSQFRNGKSGFWTVCIHHNKWTQDNSIILEEDIDKFKEKIIKLGDIELKKHRIKLIIIFNFKYIARYFRYTKHLIKRLLWKK